MSKTPCLLPRRQPEPDSAPQPPTAIGRCYSTGLAAVLATLVLSATPLLAADKNSDKPNGDKASPPAPAKPAATRGPVAFVLTSGRTLRLPCRGSAPYVIHDGSALVRAEKESDYLVLTALEPGQVSLTVNGVPFAVRVIAAAQTTPPTSGTTTSGTTTSNVPVSASAGGTTTAPATAPAPASDSATNPIAPSAATTPATPATAAPAPVTEPATPATAPVTPPASGAETAAPTAPGTPSTIPSLVPTTPTDQGTAPTAAPGELPALAAPSTPGAAPSGAPIGVPSGMAPLPAPPRVSPSLPPPARRPARSPYPVRNGMPRNAPADVPIRIVTVTKGLASLLSFRSNILSVYFSDATVMDARAVNARTLAVTGLAPGKSTLAVFTATPGDDAVGQLHMFHIVVEPPALSGPAPNPMDPVTVETAIRSALNDPRVQVTAFRPNDGGVAVRLSGRVRDAVESKAAEDTAALYATKVINGIIVDKDAPSYEQAFIPPSAPLTTEETAQNQLRLITGNQTIELTPLGGSWVLRAEVGSQAEAQQLLTLASSLNQKIVPFIVVRGPTGITPAEQPVTSPEDREMSRRLQEVTGITTVYATRTAKNGIAVYGTVRNRLEFDRIQRYKTVLPVLIEGSGGGDNVVTDHPTHAYQSPANIQMFVRIEDPNEAGMRLVTIDSNVVEISRDALKNLGIEYGTAQVLTESFTPGTPPTVVIAPDGTRTESGGTPPVRSRTIDPTFRDGSFLGGNGLAGFGGFGLVDAFRAKLNALYRNGNANILSKPNVTTLEGTEAQITIGGARPIFEIQSTGGGSGTVTENIVFRRFGIILTMRPTVLADNTIILQVRVDVSDLDPATGITRGNTFIPGETVRSVNNVLVLKEGDIIALGGLITNTKRQQTSKIPILSQIPILGALFQSRRFENNQSELAIFLTPTIKRVSVDPDLTEIGLHASSWPRLTGIDEGEQAFQLGRSGGSGGGGGGGGGK